MITARQADDVLAAARARAAGLEVAVNVAVLDAGAHLKAFSRMDGAVLGSIDVGDTQGAHRRPVRVQQRGRLGLLQARCSGSDPGTDQWRPCPVRRRHSPARPGGELIGAVGVRAAPSPRTWRSPRPASPPASSDSLPTDQPTLPPTKGPRPCPRPFSSPAPAPASARALPSVWPGTATTSSPRCTSPRRSRRCARKRRRSASRTSASSGST